MAQYRALVYNVATNGPYAYTIFKDGIGQKAVNSITTLPLAFNGARDDIAALLTAAGETPKVVAINAET